MVNVCTMNFNITVTRLTCSPRTTLTAAQPARNFSTGTREPTPRRVVIQFVAGNPWTIPIRQLSPKKENKA
jgi:hypothetical protein